MLNFSKISLVVFICLSSQAHAVVAPLLAAVIANNHDAVEQILQEGVNPNVRVEDLSGLPRDVYAGDTALHIAARRGYLNIATLLIQVPRARERMQILPKGLGQALRKTVSCLSLLAAPPIFAASFSGAGAGAGMALALSGRGAFSHEEPDPGTEIPTSGLALPNIVTVTNLENISGLTPMYYAILGGHSALVTLLGQEGGAQGITVLDFSDEFVPMGFVQALVAGLPYFAPSLQSINLDSIQIAAPEGGSLSLFGTTPTQALHLEAFTTLNGLQFPNLTQLSINGTGVGATELITFSEFLGNVSPQLQILELGGNHNFSDTGAIELAAIFAAHPPLHLTSLALHSNGIGAIGIAALAPIMQAMAAHHTLTGFNFSGNELANGSLVELSAVLAAHTALVSLDLGYTGIAALGPGTAVAGAEGLTDPIVSNAETLGVILTSLINLQTLSLQGNSMGAVFMEALVTILTNPSSGILPHLTTLDLSANDALSSPEIATFRARLHAHRPALNILI